MVHHSEIGTGQSSQLQSQFDQSLDLLALSSDSVSLPIIAYLEPPLNATIPGTASRGDPDDPKDKGTPPKYYEPLPLRHPKNLRKVVYSQITHCHQIPATLPVGRRRRNSSDEDAWNIGDDPLPENYTEEELLFCPVDYDPFLPWIHDLFLDLDGERVQFVAQNKRRCKTGKKYGDILEHMQPQVALLQPVSVQRISEEDARRIAPDLQGSPEEAPRYRLSTYQDASEDGKFTRFICKFHTSSGTHLGETLSVYPFNYELAAYRKTNTDFGLLTSKGKDNTKFWTSTLLFSCPLPPKAKTLAAAAMTTHKDKPMFHVDVIPIRTPPRFSASSMDVGHYFPKEMVGDEHVGSFDPARAWGNNHVLPPVGNSGRWENLPICPVSSSTPALPLAEKETAKPHLLSACLWASAAYQTRGTDKNPLSDTTLRLLEWIEFHLLVGFDHIYVYDNSDDETNNLKAVTDLFPSTQVTWIDWPHVVCNNNVGRTCPKGVRHIIPAHDNTGERSSQYAAENSCRTRYAPLTEWIAAFDTDEYLVPMGEHTNLRTVLEQANSANILSFRSSRGKLLLSATEEQRLGRTKLSNVTFLEAYNCDGSETPRPKWSERARKQLYRPDYVPYHFVHYAAVTKGLMAIPSGGEKWSRSFMESSTSERTTDEIHEAMMIHAKSITQGHTMSWESRCAIDGKRKRAGCYVGFPWPSNTKSRTDNYDPDTKMEYNCFKNAKVDSYWIPRLTQALEARRKKANF
eukprot:scaffold9523_cov103-Cylindrotheca_fusiformis.AAC.6